MLKRLSCAILIISICLSVPVGAKQYNDIKQSEYSEEIGLISALGIMSGYEDNSFRPDNTITRAEFAKIVISLYNMGDQLNNVEDSRFKDVPDDHWAKKYINATNELKLMRGDNNGNFLPDSNISIQDAASVFVNVLGYSQKAEAMGGYPTGSNIVAQQIKLFNKMIYDTITENLKRLNAAHMIYSVLNADYIDVVSISDGEASYKAQDGVAFLNSRFDVYKQKGVVTGTPVTTLDEKTVLSRGKLEIDNEVYYNRDVEVNHLIGRNVTAFYKLDVDEKYIMSIYEDSSKEKIISLDAEDIVDVSNIFTAAGKIVYWDENKEKKNSKTLTISPVVKVIYNGKIVGVQDINSVDFTVKSAQFDCVDWGDNNMIDVLNIKAYENFIVDQLIVKSDKNRIFDIFRKALEYDPSDEEFFTKIYKDGLEVEFKTIAKDDVVTVASSLDNKAIEMNIANKIIEGEITEIGTDDTEDYIAINNERYNISPNYIKDSTYTLSIGDKGKFNLDIFGKVAYYTASSDSIKNYAYLVKAVAMNGFEKAQVKLLLPDNTFEIYNLQDKIKFSRDGLALSDITSNHFVSFVARTPIYYDNRDTETQVITYKLNSTGEIKEIRLAQTTSSLDEFSIAAPEYSRYFSSSLFDQKWKVTPQTIVFNIPCTRAGEEPTRYSAGKTNQYFKDGANYQVLMYDVSKNGEIGAIMYRIVRDPRYLNYTVNFANSPVMVIEKITSSLDKEGKVRQKITGISSGEYVSVFLNDSITSDTTLMSKLKFGNIIQYQTNKAELLYAENVGNDEELAVFKVILDNSNRVYKQYWNYTNIYSIEPDIATSLGVVSAFDSYRITLSMANNPKDATMPFYVSAQQKVVSISTANQKLSIITPSEISYGQTMFVRQRYNRIRDVVVFE